MTCVISRHTASSSTTAQRHPQKVAIVLEDQMWTYGELVEHVQRVACQLHYLQHHQGTNCLSILSNAASK